jgi:uncharacterized protein YbaP (TraB family)
MSVASCTQQPSPAPPVWRIERGDTTVYLFGSAHMLTPQARWRSPGLDHAMADAEDVVFEVVPGDAMIAETQAQFAALGRNPDGVMLTSLLPPSVQAQLVRVAGTLELSVEALEPLRPWLAAQQLAFFSAVRQGADPNLGVEAVLGAQAEAAGKSLSALETAQQQVALVAGLPLPDQVQFLAATLTQIEEDPQGLARSEQSWTQGDIPGLQAMNATLQAQIGPALYDAMIVQRNKAFAQAATERLAGQDDVLIVVGAAHLIGDAGVIALLRAQGITVVGP